MWLGRVGLGAKATGGGGFGSAFVRYFSRKRADNLRKINPKVSPQEASSIARHLYDLLKQNGPLTVSNAWLQAQVLLLPLPQKLKYPNLALNNQYHTH